MNKQSFSINKHSKKNSGHLSEEGLPNGGMLQMFSHYTKEQDLKAQNSLLQAQLNEQLLKLEKETQEAKAELKQKDRQLNDQTAKMNYQKV